MSGENIKPLSELLGLSYMINGARPRWISDDELAFVNFATGGEGYIADLSDYTLQRLDVGPVLLVEPGPEGLLLVLKTNNEYYAYRENRELRQLTSTGGQARFGVDWIVGTPNIAYNESGTDVVVVDTLGNEISRNVIVPDSLSSVQFIVGTLEWLPHGTELLVSLYDKRKPSAERYSLLWIDLSNDARRTIIAGRTSLDANWNFIN